MSAPVVPTDDVQKMTQAEDGKSAFCTGLSAGTNPPIRVLGGLGGIGWEPFHAFNSCLSQPPCSSSPGIGVAKAADPALLAETGGFLLGNAHRCGVSD